ncbi:MAG: DUF4012 domain-containing protein [Candidatus Berkelbacteria bacterium]|nr:DUF4012 domain-containing protein [Candidatus Berkelbacteria bacterium]
MPKRIEDIKRVVKKVDSRQSIVDSFGDEIQEINPEDEGSTRDIEGQQEKKKGNENRRPVTNLFGKVMLVVIIVAIFGSFFAFAMLRAKAKIESQTANISQDLDGFQVAVSKKDFLALGNYLKSFNDKSTNSVIILQSAGQDIQVLNLLYPAGRESKITSLVDGVRAAHLVSSSFENLAKVFSGVSPAPNSSPDDYLSKINSKLSTLAAINGKLKNNISSANFSSRLAVNLSNSPQSAGGNQKTIENIHKLAETSADFFQYFSSIPSELSSNLTFSGGKKSYLILFQNNAELRPGGGFIGSFARLDLENGHLTALDFQKNIYTLDSEYLATGANNPSSGEFFFLTPNLTMRDANTSADFAKSAKNVSDFYQKESGSPAGESVDGVFAIDTTLFRNLFGVVGPIEMSKYNLTVTPENFLAQVQYQVEIGYYQNQANWATNQPKTILADMMPIFLDKIFQSQNAGAVLSQIISGLNQKHLMFYFSSPKLEDLVAGLSAGGIINQNSSGDYLMLSDANLGGQKSSLNVAETADQNITINSDGSASEKLTISRTHNGTMNWPDGVNNNYLKIYLPLAATISSTNFLLGNNDPMSNSSKIQPSKIANSAEFGKQVVGFWQNTKPGETSQTEINYSRAEIFSPSDQTFDYVINLQKQPGVETLNYNLYIVYPAGWHPQNVVNYDSLNRKIYLKNLITSDQVFRLHFIRS